MLSSIPRELSSKISVLHERKMVNFIVWWIAFSSLSVIVQGVIVKQPCPVINAIQNYTFSRSSLKLRLKYLMPMEEVPWSPFYISPNDNMAFYLYSITPKDDHLAVSVSCMNDLNTNNDLYMINSHTSKSKHDYNITYNSMIENNCAGSKLRNFKLMYAENNNLFVFWACTELANNTSIQGGSIFVNINTNNFVTQSFELDAFKVVDAKLFINVEMEKKNSQCNNIKYFEKCQRDFKLSSWSYSYLHNFIICICILIIIILIYKFI